MQRKLDWLALDPEKPDSYGNVYINMKFDDGTVAYKAGKPGDMTQHYADLLGIQKSGELVEIDLEDTGKKTQKGATKYKLVGYPGWSAPVAQGGKAQANAHSNGSSDREDSIFRCVALKLAAKLSVQDPDLYQENVTMLFNFYLKLLRGEGQQDATAHQERTTDPIPASTSGGEPQPAPARRGPQDSRATEPADPPASTSAPAGNHGEGATGAAVSEGGPGLTGGSRAGSPEGNPWEGMDV